MKIFKVHHQWTINKLQKIKVSDKGRIKNFNQIIHDGESTSIIKHILNLLEDRGITFSIIDLQFELNVN